MAFVVEVSSLAELEDLILDLWSDAPHSVRVRVARLKDLFEAYPLLSRLEKQVRDSRGTWRLEGRSHALLLQASEYYRSLDLLELLLDLMRMNIEEGIAMKKIRFDGVRQTANEVVANADHTSAFMVLDNITMEGQRIARVANLLGLGGADVEEGKLAEDDIQWFLADLREDEGAELAAPGEGALSDRVDALHLGDWKDLNAKCGDWKDLNAKCGDQKDLNTNLNAECGDQKDLNTMGGDQKDLNTMGGDQKDKDSKGADCKDMYTKEDVTKGVLLHKISNLQELVQICKRGPFIA